MAENALEILPMSCFGRLSTFVKKIKGNLDKIKAPYGLSCPSIAGNLWWFTRRQSDFLITSKVVWIKRPTISPSRPKHLNRLHEASPTAAGSSCRTNPARYSLRRQYKTSQPTRTRVCTTLWRRQRNLKRKSKKKKRHHRQSDQFNHNSLHAWNLRSFSDGCAWAIDEVCSTNHTRWLIMK